MAQSTVRSVSPFKAWLYVGLLAIVGCLNYIDRIMITTMRGSIMESIPMSETQFALLTAVFLWVYGVLSPVGGYLADRFKRSSVVVISLFIWSIVTWLTAHAQNFHQLLATRALMGISEACYLPAALALITDYHTGSTRSFAVGVHMVGVIAGQALGFLGGWMAESHSWNYPFVFFGLTGVAYAILLLLVLRDHPERGQLKSQSRPSVQFGKVLADLFNNRSYVYLLIFWGLLGVIGWLIIGWLPTFYQERFSLSQSVAGLYATGYLYTASMVGVLLGGFWADRWSKTNKRARLLVPAIGLLVAAPAIFFSAAAHMVVAAVVGFMVYAFTKAFSDANMMPALCMVADERYRATGYGVLNLASCVVGGLGIFAGGYLRDAAIDLRYQFFFAGIIALVCAFILLGLATKRRL